MGYKLRDFENFLGDPRFVLLCNRANLSCFFLYKDEHVGIRDYLRNNFEQLHERSGEALHFFTLDQISNYDAYSNQGIDLERNNACVDTACDYFRVSPRLLPAVVLFSDLGNRSCNVFYLKLLNSIDALEDFFYILIQEATNNRRRSSGMNTLIAASNSINCRFPFLDKQIFYFNENSSIEGAINEISNKLDEEFAKVHIELHTIQEGVANLQEKLPIFRKEMQDKLDIIEKQRDDCSRSEALEVWHEDFDNRLLEYQVDLNTYTVESETIEQSEYIKYFGEKSVHMIKSCIFTERAIEDGPFRHNDENFDYSVCGVGYWKALEIELNILVVDSIRKVKGLIDSIPSGGLSLRDSPCKIKIVEDPKSSLYISYDVNKKDNGVLCNVMLGNLANTLKYFQQNEFKNVLDTLYNPEENSQDIQEFMSKFSDDIFIVLDIYRNRCSHTEILTITELSELKSLLFNVNGPYRKISSLKARIGLL